RASDCGATRPRPQGTVSGVRGTGLHRRIWRGGTGRILARPGLCTRRRRRWAALRAATPLSISGSAATPEARCVGSEAAAAEERALRVARRIHLALRPAARTDL